MPSGDASPFEIFRPGQHTATSGRSIAFSDADVAAIASAYDPAIHEAPIVVGHPRDDAPAYGWVAGLQVDAGRLTAKPQQLDPAFAELVSAGRFKKVSASFYAPDSPTNPKPGGWYLRHVGFLGAQPPAVKGLKTASFADGETGVVEFAETWTLGLVAWLFGSLRDMLIAQFGADAADKALPRDAIDTIAQAEAPMPPAAISPAYSETTGSDAVANSTAAAPPSCDPPSLNPETIMPDPQAEAAAAALAAREAALAAREAEIAERDRAARTRDDTAFCEGLVKAARLPKGLVPLAVGILGRADAGEAVSFAEGAAAETAHAALRRLLAALPNAVEFRELAAAGTATPQADGTVDGITRAAEAYIKAQADQGHTVSFLEASRIVADQANGKGAKA